MWPAPRSLNGATFLPTNWQDRDKEHLDSPFCIGDSFRVSKHKCPKVVFTWRQSLFWGNNDVVFSLNGYLQETKAAIEDPKLITSTASSTGPGMNGPPKLFNKRPSQLNVNVPGGFHTLQDFAPFGQNDDITLFWANYMLPDPGFYGTTFPHTKQWDRDKGHLDSPFLHRRQGQGQQWVYNTVSHTMLDQTLASWLEHDSEFPELLVLESKLEWIFKDALDSVSDSESH